MISHLDTVATVRLQEHRIALANAARIHELTAGAEATASSARRLRSWAKPMATVSALADKIGRRAPHNRPVGVGDAS